MEATHLIRLYWRLRSLRAYRSQTAYSVERNVRVPHAYVRLVPDKFYSDS